MVIAGEKIAVEFDCSNLFIQILTTYGNKLTLNFR